MEQTKSILHLWFPCCLQCSGYFSDAELSCGNCQNKTELDMDKIETKEGKTVDEVTDGFDYDLMPGVVLKTVCPDCSKLSYFKMFGNEIDLGSSISFVTLEEMNEE